MKRKYLALIIIVMLFVSFLVVSISLRKGDNPMTTLLDGHSESNYNIDGELSVVHPSSISALSAVGQAFKVKTVGEMYKLTQLKVYLRKVGNPTGHLVAKLYAMTGTYGTDAKPTGSPLATSELIDMANIGTGYGEVAFNFTDEYIVEKDQPYPIAVQVNDGTVNYSNRIEFKFSSGSKATHDGNQFGYTESAWYSYSPFDLCFLVYGEYYEGPPPGSRKLTMLAPSGSGTVDPGVGEHWYDWNTYVTLTASPADGWEFKWWLVGANYWSQNPMTFPITENIVVKGFFAEPPPPPPAMKIEMAIRLSRNLALKPGEKVFIKEDFTGYSEVEPDDRIQKTASHVDHLAFRNEDSYLYKDKGVDYFKSVVHKVDVCSDFAQQNAIGVVWMLANDVDDWFGLLGANKTFVSLYVYYRSTSPFRCLLLNEGYGGVQYFDMSVTLTALSWYFLRIEKSGSSLICDVYSSSELRDAGSGNDGDVDTLVLTLHGDWSFRYIYACNSFNDGATQFLNTDVENLELQGRPYSLLWLV